MNRTTRSFKLRLSPAGMDLLIDSHCHLIRSTRRLIAWGTTLHVAVDHLATMPTTLIAARLGIIRESGHAGVEEHHLGASRLLVATASGIAKRVRGSRSGAVAPPLGHIYLLALQELVNADKASLLTHYERTRRREVRTK